MFYNKLPEEEWKELVSEFCRDGTVNGEENMWFQLSNEIEEGGEWKTTIREFAKSGLVPDDEEKIIHLVNEITEGEVVYVTREEKKKYDVITRLIEIVEIDVSHNGLYRKPGIQSQIEKLRLHDGKWEEVFEFAPKQEAASLLKKILLHELPPLLPGNVGGKDPTVADVEEMLNNTSPYQKVILGKIIKHLQKVIDDPINEMTLLAVQVSVTVSMQMVGKSLEILLRNYNCYFHQNNEIKMDVNETDGEGRDRGEDRTAGNREGGKMARVLKWARRIFCCCC